MGKTKLQKAKSKPKRPKSGNGASQRAVSGRNAGLRVSREVEGAWGSLEELARFVMVEEPGLLDAPVDVRAERLGLPVDVVRFLFGASREFLALLDWHVAREEWGVRERRAAYGVLKDRVLSGEEKLGESVRALEFLDGKTGTVAAPVQREVARTQVAVQIVQDGGEWKGGEGEEEGVGYESLEFGGEAARAAGSDGEGGGGPIEVSWVAADADEGGSGA